MTDDKIKETLEKQMQLLSERSQNADDSDLVELTDAMISLAKMLRSLP